MSNKMCQAVVPIFVIFVHKYFCKQTYIADTPVFFLGSCCVESYYVTSFLCHTIAIPKVQLWKNEI